MEVQYGIEVSYNPELLVPNHILVIVVETVDGHKLIVKRTDGHSED